MTRVSAARQPFELEAAMLNLRLATAMAGHQPTVTLLPGGPRSDAVAVVRRVHGVIYRRSNARCSRDRDRVARTSLADHLVPDAPCTFRSGLRSSGWSSPRRVGLPWAVRGLACRSGKRGAADCLDRRY